MLTTAVLQYLRGAISSNIDPLDRFPSYNLPYFQGMANRESILNDRKN